MSLAKYLLLSFLLLALLPLLAACGGQGTKAGFDGSPYIDPGRMEKDEIVHLPTGTRLTRSELFELLAAARVVFIGEGHDNIYDHRVELEVIEALARLRPGRIMVGFEMLDAESQSGIDNWLAGRLSEDDFIRLFARQWGVYDYIYYRDIFAFLKDKQIPTLGLNVSRRRKMEFMRRFKQSGSAAVATEPADPYQEKALRAMFAGHAGGHGDFGIFFAVQRLWEETMAGNIAKVLNETANRDKIMVVISGEFHIARGYGLPRKVFQRLKLPYATLLTTTPPRLYENQPQTMDVDFPALPLYLGDYLWCVPYRNLKERQVRLGVGLKKVLSGDGIEIVMVAADTPAARAGLEKGDVLLSCDGQSLDDPLDLSLYLLRRQPGDEIELRIKRHGRPLTLPVRLIPDE
jgi:uncharacterized iron-regulated protein